MIGRTYVLRGEPVRVLARWGGGGARSRFASMPLPRGVTHHSYVYGDPRDRMTELGVGGPTEAVWVPARVYWEGQLFSARTPEGVEEWECRAPEPLRAVELLRDKVAFGLHVPSARVQEALQQWSERDPS